MAAWIWVVIPVVAIVGAFILDYQKNKMKMMNRGVQNEQEVDELRKLTESLKKRIENLEAIAAGDPVEFQTGSGRGIREIEIEEEDQQQSSDPGQRRRARNE